MNRSETFSVWNMLLQSWGQKFAEQYGTAPNDAWQAMLANVTPDAAMHAYRKALRETPTFPPTLGDFLAWVQEWRPSQSREGMAIGRDYMSATTEQLHRNASNEVASYNTYRDYERWRDAHTVKGKKPAHPTPDSPDWLYLQRLAWIQAAADNRRTVAGLCGAA